MVRPTKERLEEIKEMYRGPFLGLPTISNELLQEVYALENELAEHRRGLLRTGVIESAGLYLTGDQWKQLSLEIKGYKEERDWLRAQLVDAEINVDAWKKDADKFHNEMSHWRERHAKLARALDFITGSCVTANGARSAANHALDDDAIASKQRGHDTQAAGDT